MNKKEVDSISYNAIIDAGVKIGTNAYQYTPNILSLAYYYDTFQAPIIDDPSKYTLTITAFDIPLQAFPLNFIARNQLVAGIPPSDSTTYFVTLKYGNFTSTVNLLWIPEDTFNTQYSRALFTIKHFIDMINTGFYNAYVALLVQTALPSPYAPYYIYDNTNYTMSLVADINGYNSDNNGIQIYLNSELYNIFFNLSATFVNGDPTGINNLNFLMEVTNNGNNLYDQTGTNTVLYYDINAQPITKINSIVCVMKQEYSTLWNLSIAENVVLSTSLPIDVERQSPEYINIGAPLFPKNLGQGAFASSNGNFIPLLTDFKLGGAVNEFFPSSRQRVNYANQNNKLNRQIQMVSGSPICNISLQIYMQDRFGRLYPLYLYNGSSASIKITFNKIDGL